MRTGVDLGGTKIEAVVIDADDAVMSRQRVATPVGDYAQTVKAVASLVQDVEQAAGSVSPHVGIGVPGSPSPTTGLMRNCNSTVLNGKRFREDLEVAIGRPVRMANDANCLALSEATTGAAVGASPVFAIILGTGVGGGWAIDGQLVGGFNGVAGEWGHMPLPWPHPDERNPDPCWCGQVGCLETWLSGPALEARWLAGGHEAMRATAIVDQYPDAPIVQQWFDQLARATAVIMNVLDPEVIVVGGGLSRIGRLYEEVPARWGAYVFSDDIRTRMVPAHHGDSSGVFGAARLEAAFTRPAH